MSDYDIRTAYYALPIPIRSSDWCAYTMDRNGDYISGWGATEKEALADLEEQIKEAEEDGRL